MRLTRQEIVAENAKRAFGVKLDEQFYRQMRNELLDYKFIEEELGIDLITLFKELKNGVYVDTDRERKYEHFDFYYDIDNEFTIWLGRPHSLKDYGKTWALTKEELK